MYASYIVRRTQIYIDEEQDRRLAERALATGRTKSDLIREAVDRLLDEPLSEEEELARFRAAADAAFGIAPYLEDGATMSASSATSTAAGRTPASGSGTVAPIEAL